MSATYLEIVEIKEVTKNGALEPRLCLAEDDNYYYVKSEYNAHHVDMIFESIAGWLAVYCSLPIPPVKVVLLSEDIVKVSGMHDPVIKKDVKPNSYAFASSRIEGATPLQKYNIHKIDKDLRARVLLFDYWIQNSDRKMPTLEKTNPNFLVDPSTGDPFLIDHNNAFKYEFNSDEFFDKHIFRDSRADWSKELLDKEFLKYENALNHFDDILQLFPTKEWEFGKRILKCYNTKVEFMNLLSRYKSEDWI